MLNQRAEAGLILTQRVLCEETEVLPHGEDLAQYHEAGHEEGAYRKSADRIRPGTERREHQQGVRRTDREIGQGADALKPGEWHRGGCPLGDRPPPIELSAGDQHDVADQEDAVRPTGSAVADLKLHQIEREVRNHTNRHAGRQQTERQPVRVRRPAKQHSGDAEQHQHARERVGEGHEGDDEAALLRCSRGTDREVPDRDPAADQHHGGIEQELPALQTGTARQRKREESGEREQ